MRILIACEESQILTSAFRSLEMPAQSCDLLPTSGLHPEWHLQQDVTPLLQEYWDLIVAFPPCTHLANSGAAHFAQKFRDGRMLIAQKFFMKFVEANSPRIAIENPIGVMSKEYRQPDQYVQPWQFGHPYTKKTCLWLKGLPLLEPTCIVEPELDIILPSGKTISPWFKGTGNLPGYMRSLIRSKTPKGLAKAMAKQWGSSLLR